MKSLAQLRRYHAEMSADYQKLDGLKKEHGVLPPPPLPGMKGKTVPLRTQSELVGEGREQKNCVATYAAGVAAGKCFIYRVLYSGRATLCIRRQSDGNWEFPSWKHPATGRWTTLPRSSSSNGWNPNGSGFEMIDFTDPRILMAV